MNSQEYADFREAMFGEPYMVWHDGAGFEEICAEWERDPVRVEAMLLQGLSEGDSLAADSIRELPLDAAATARFVSALADVPAGGSMAVSVGESLARLTGDEAHATMVAQVLTGAGFWSGKIDAARALSRFAATDEVIAALEHGMVDAEYLVRYHSANALLVHAGDPEQDLSQHQDDFGVIVADEPAGWQLLADRYGAAARARLT
ncbi:MAG: hypothetical protein JWM34_1897 [Ilumatobacteraceae bacterium]|nr:hypothetical protein [Ilumatobacteraceae bacterium]